MSNTSPSKRIESLDGLRGVASFVVLIFHVLMMLLALGSSFPYEMIPGAPSVLVFFVLSGVVLSIVPFACLREGRPYDWFSYYPRRVVRLGVPVVAAIVLGLVGGFVAWKMGSGARSAMAVDYAGGLQAITHDVFMQFDLLFNVSNGAVTLYGAPLERVDSPVWSMSWEFWFSLTLPLAIFVVWRAKRDKAAFALMVAAIAVSFYSGYFPLRLCVMFWMGVLLAKHLKEVAELKVNPVIEIVVLILSLGLIELSQAGSAGIVAMTPLVSMLVDTLMSLACFALVVLCVIDGLVRRALSTRPVKFLGKISYSLYLTNAIVVGALAALFSKVGLSFLPVQVLVAIVLCLGVAWAFWRLFEKPSIDWSRKMKEQSAK